MNNNNDGLWHGLFDQFKRRLSKRDRSHVKEPLTDDVSPLFYSGTWRYVDDQHNRTHQLEISPDMSVKIDHQPLQVTVKSMTKESLIFIDKFGYRLVLTANDKQPTHLFDEADNQDYLILIADK